MRKITLPSHSPMTKPAFLYGVATASFQIEGAADSRLPCIWDTFCSQEGKIADKSDGKVACDHVSRWRDDVNLIESFGVDAYRLSISWPRVMTKDNTLNNDGIQFYIDLLDELKARGIKAFVTLYHWDLPQHFEDNGGWLNRETAYHYQQYVDTVSKALGDRVYSYATFNEPFCSAFLGYEAGIHAPGIASRKAGRQAAHHILLAHGLGMEVLRKNSPNSLNGIVLNFTPCYPKTDAPEDAKATDYADQYINQWYIQPLMQGSYPDIFHKLPKDDQPEVQDGDLSIINCAIDFLGVNFYTRLTYSAPQQAVEFYFEHEHMEPRTDIGWEIYPQALVDLLTGLHEKYSLPPIYITENGAAMADKLENGQVDDLDRIDYYNQHLNAVHKAIEAGVNIEGYFAWSLMDNFEWAEGYSKRFGLTYVDYDTQERIVKSSGKAYKALLAERK